MVRNRKNVTFKSKVQSLQCAGTQGDQTEWVMVFPEACLKFHLSIYHIPVSVLYTYHKSYFYFIYTQVIFEIFYYFE